MGKNKKITVIVLAAGKSERFGQNKILYELNGVPVIIKTLKTIYQLSNVENVIVVCSKENIKKINDILNNENFQTNTVTVLGGITRMESLLKAVNYCDMNNISDEIIIVQDAARPNATLELYQKGIESLDNYHAVVPGIKPNDTVKIIDNNNIVIKTMNRESIMNIQTPQFFDRKVLVDNINLKKDLLNLTDDSSIFDDSSIQVKIIKGTHENLKITNKSDIDFFHQNIKYGIGFDVHKLIPHKYLTLGGIKIDYPFKLEGHSDGDALIHSIIDSILGACGLGDIGHYFSSEDTSFKDIDSQIMLSEIKDMVNKKGFEILHIDNTIIAQQPRMNNHLKKMKINLSKTLDLNVNNINIKSTTTDQLGIIGSEKAIAAQSITTIKKIY
ncbi:MAG: 2-C-methyl-D-erythritol 2,4-cyclodiphosphate synthase [Chloroflexota bacterium]|nr:2-C-methyl-D-erythritol 2,4-cyclodiphosphate synthase [Chloroflexota bacterium]